MVHFAINSIDRYSYFVCRIDLYRAPNTTLKLCSTH